MNDQEAETSAFEAIRHEHDDGNEYWSARELAKVLGYTEYAKFRNTVRKAEIACEGSGQTVSDHFAHVSDMIAIGKGGQRQVEDVHLSRYACYLVVQNADPDKPVVALGQTYFAVQTRRQELADEAALQSLSEDQQRIYVRGQLAGHNKQLADAARVAGVLTNTDFATFQNHGYRGLYAGESAAMIAKRKGLRSGQQILDYMGSTELAANLFRATQTQDKLQREGITDKNVANKAHNEMGKAVRAFIVEQGGTPPEQLPTPTESVQQVQRREQKRVEAKQQPSLFSSDDLTEES